jgi:hypothetical protein
VGVRFIGSGNRSTRRKQSIVCRKVDIKILDSQEEKYNGRKTRPLTKQPDREIRRVKPQYFALDVKL